MSDRPKELGRFKRRGKDGVVREFVVRPMSPAFKMFYHMKACRHSHKAGDPDCATCASIRAEIQRDIEAAGRDSNA